MPDIQLPEMSGIGDGLVGDIGGFEIMPNLDEGTMFGSSQSVGNDLEGVLYDFKRFRNGRNNVGYDVRGEKYKGYMILVYNERDEIIAQNLSHDWLLDLRDKLVKLPVGRHFDKAGERVHPPRPKFTDRHWEMSP